MLSRRLPTRTLFWLSPWCSPITPKPPGSRRSWLTPRQLQDHTRELLSTKAKSDAILLHSLPRMDEIPPDVDITRWSRYWQEAFNGVVMRMALLGLVLGAME